MAHNRRTRNQEKKSSGKFDDGSRAKKLSRTAHVIRNGTCTRFLFLNEFNRRRQRGGIKDREMLDFLEDGHDQGNCPDNERYTYIVNANEMNERKQKDDVATTFRVSPLCRYAKFAQDVDEQRNQRVRPSSSSGGRNIPPFISSINE